MDLDLNSLQSSLRQLDSALQTIAEPQVASLKKNFYETLRAGVIQQFEVAYEQCWKFMKRYLEMNLGASYVDGISRRELFRLSAEHQLIENIEEWLDFHYARNLSSHTYELKTAEEVFELAVQFNESAKQFFQSLEKKL